MIMLNIVGPKSYLNEVAKRVVLLGSIHPVNAIEEIDTTDFTFPTTEDNIKALEDVCYIRPYSEEDDYGNLRKKIKGFEKIYEGVEKASLKKEELLYSMDDIESLACELEEKISPKYNVLKELRSKKIQLQQKIEHFKYIKNLDIDIKELYELDNFDFKIIKIQNENIPKLKYNYENIPSIVLKIYSHLEYCAYMVFTPKSLYIESERIFKALSGEIIEVTGELRGTPSEILKGLEEKLKTIDENISIEGHEVKEILKQNNKKLLILQKSFELEMKGRKIKSHTGVTEEFFYLCGWMPLSSLKNFKNTLKDLENKLIVIKKNSNEINPNLIPPTKLKNNKITKPFESMVNMYGIPSYKEIDPTGFLAVTYMIMFGIMFGDLGQGLIFVMAGILLKYKKSKVNFGGVLTRIGISSCIFGTLYGSFFGFENVIPAILGRPMENINKVLTYAIGFGCVLLLGGYVFNFINCYKRKDIKEGIFGSNGLAGLVFYICFIGFIFTKFTKSKIQMPVIVWIIIFITLIAVILFKEPLSNLVVGKKPLYSESKGDYYIESGFGILEVFLSMLSNTLSFIRVGAFAINHAGLFLAFSAIASMMNNGFGSILMYVLGNLVIIGLEGLIVFIQGLRLEYYELFSKYYEGGGISYSPVNINLL